MDAHDADGNGGIVAHIDLEPSKGAVGRRPALEVRADPNKMGAHGSPPPTEIAKAGERNTDWRRADGILCSQLARDLARQAMFSESALMTSATTSATVDVEVITDREEHSRAELARLRSLVIALSANSASPQHPEPRDQSLHHMGVGYASAPCTPQPSPGRQNIVAQHIPVPSCSQYGVYTCRDALSDTRGGIHA